MGTGQGGAGGTRINLLQIRFAFLQMLNKRLQRILPYVDLSTGLEYRTGHKLRRLGYCIFYDLKMELLETALRATAQNGGNIPLNLDHQKKTLSQVAGPTQLELARSSLVSPPAHIDCSTFAHIDCSSLAHFGCS